MEAVFSDFGTIALGAFLGAVVAFGTVDPDNLRRLGPMAFSEWFKSTGSIGIQHPDDVADLSKV